MYPLEVMVLGQNRYGTICQTTSSEVVVSLKGEVEIGINHKCFFLHCTLIKRTCQLKN